MLNVRRFLCTTKQYSSVCMCNETFTRYALHRAAAQTMLERPYSHSVPQKMLIDEEDIKKYKLDPRVKAVFSKLLYSDYIERKSLRYGYKKNIMILRQMGNRLKAKKRKQLIEEPAMSVALKYYRDNEKRNDEKISVTAEEEETFDNDKCEPDDKRMIHMPYASIDQYEKLDYTVDDSTVKITELNETYKDLYEKYLATKKSKDKENFEELIESAESVNEIPLKRSIEEAENIPPDWMTDYEQYDDSLEDDSSQSNYGTPNPEIPVSSVPCGGCGALLHCQDPAIPGYLPSELFKDQRIDVLRSSTCQRCHFIKNYKTALDVKVSPEEYPALLSHIKKKKVAVILMIDLTDFPCSIWPGLMDIIGKTTQVFVVGNKVDLLPNDGPNFLKNVEESLLDSLRQKGINNINIKSVNLISAKTGFGIEQLINRLHKYWKYKGNVYLIGCTNVGKSSLFNALLDSDYCKIQAANFIQRATISNWPGTTLNLLKFPILSPVRWRLWMRTQRLKAQYEATIEEREYRNGLLKDSKKIRHATLEGHVGKTFGDIMKNEGQGFFGNNEAVNVSGYFGINERSKVYRDSQWCFDTPGTIHPDSILHLLTTEELMLTLSRQIIAPRTFHIEKKQTLFLAGLGRLDFVEGCQHIKCTVFASNDLPITICRTRDADDLYKNLLLSEAFVVPKNDPERLKVFPALEPETLNIAGSDMKISCADIVLSSAGWVAVTVGSGQEVVIRAWTPQGKGIYVRKPAMLSRSVRFAGRKLQDSPAFRGGKQVFVKP